MKSGTVRKSPASRLRSASALRRKKLFFLPRKKRILSEINKDDVAGIFIVAACCRGCGVIRGVGRVERGERGGEVMHKFARSAKKQNTSRRRDEKRGRGRVDATRRWKDKRGRRGRKKCRQKGDRRERKAERGQTRAILHTRCINRNKFQWMPKHFPPIFFRRSTYHTPEYLRERYTVRFIF